MYRFVAAVAFFAVVALAAPATAQTVVHADDGRKISGFTFEVGPGALDEIVTVWLVVTSGSVIPDPQITGGNLTWSLVQIGDDDGDASAGPKRRLMVYQGLGVMPQGIVDVSWQVTASAGIVVLRHKDAVQVVSDAWNEGPPPHGRATSTTLSLPTPPAADNTFIAGVAIGDSSATISQSSCEPVAQAGQAIPMFVYACDGQVADWAWSGDPNGAHWMATGIEVGTAEPPGDPCAALAAENALLKAIIATMSQPRGGGR